MIDPGRGPASAAEAISRAVDVCRHLEGPAVVNVSGGRSSGLLLWCTIQAARTRPGSRADFRAVFANTGKEHEATLRFVRDMASHWNVRITWLERASPTTEPRSWRRVDFESASRNGEPFEALIREQVALPDPRTRTCTAELKAGPVGAWCRDHLGWTHWLSLLGIRADERERVGRAAACAATPRRDTMELPLAIAGVTSDHVLEFWREMQPFDLQLGVDLAGRTILGNCDLCFMKGTDAIGAIIRSEPERAAWWAAQERWVARHAPDHRARFRWDRPSYAELLDGHARQGDRLDNPSDLLCDCTD